MVGIQEDRIELDRWDYTFLELKLGVKETWILKKVLGKDTFSRESKGKKTRREGLRVG